MAVLFDLDGTILGTYREKIEVRNECAREMGLPEMSNEKYYEVFNRIMDNSKVETRVPIFEEILGDRDTAEELAKEYRKRSLENTYVYPEAKEVLRNLPGKKALITNGPRLVQREKLKKFDLADYFDSIFISGEIGKSKPGEEIFLLALDSLESTPDESLYVGNSLRLDVAGANNAGLTSVLISRDEDSVGSEPDYEIKDLKELYEIVDVMNNSA